MGILERVKKNVPKVSLDNYVWVISGIPKAGKTTLFKEVVKRHYKGDLDKALLIAFEKGYQALDGINAVDIESWDDFEELVEELVERRDEIPYRFLGLDTADVMYEMCEKKVIKEWNIKHPDKRTDDIAGVGARGNSDQGYGQGYARIKKKMRDAIDKLIKAGYGLMIITHSKDKKVKQRDGSEFDQLTLSLSTTAREIFVNMADFVVFITVEKVKTKSGIETKRYIWFRTDGYVEAGSRFTNVPEKIEYDPDEFLRVFEEAVKSAVGNADIEKLAKEQAEERERQAREFVETVKKSKEETPEGFKAAIKLIIDKMDQDQKRALAKRFKDEFGDANYTKFEDVEVLKRALEITKEVAEEDEEDTE